MSSPFAEAWVMEHPLIRIEYMFRMNVHLLRKTYDGSDFSKGLRRCSLLRGCTAGISIALSQSHGYCTSQ